MLGVTVASSTAKAGLAAAKSSSKGSPTVAPAPKNTKKEKQTTRGISASNGTSKQTGAMVTSKATPNPTNTATPPGMTSDLGAFGIDAYRDGGLKDAGNDPLLQKYTLSDYEYDEDAAEMWLIRNDTNTEIISSYSRFFLQAVQESTAEKYQIVETFTHFYSFFYGTHPSIYRYSGVLIDDPNFRWAHDFRFMYDNFFKGTQASELNAVVTMYYSGKRVSGLLVGMSTSQQAMDPKVVQFSMDLLVLEYETHKFSPDIAALLNKKQRELLDLKAQIQRELSLINQNIPTEQRLAAGQVFSGKKGGSRVKSKGTQEKTTSVEARQVLGAGKK